MREYLNVREEHGLFTWHVTRCDSIYELNEWAEKSITNSHSITKTSEKWVCLHVFRIWKNLKERTSQSEQSEQSEHRLRKKKEIVFRRQHIPDSWRDNTWEEEITQTENKRKRTIDRRRDRATSRSTRETRDRDTNQKDERILEDWTLIIQAENISFSVLWNFPVISLSLSSGFHNFRHRFWFNMYLCSRCFSIQHITFTAR